MEYKHLLDKQSLIELNLGFQNAMYVNSYKESALMICCKINKLEMVKRLYNTYPYNLNDKDANGYDVLMLSCRYKHSEIAEWLINNTNINLNSTNNDSDSAFSLACKLNLPDIALLILSKNIVIYNCRNVFGDRPIDYCKDSPQVYLALQTKIKLNSVIHYTESMIRFKDSEFLIINSIKYKYIKVLSAKDIYLVKHAEGKCVACTLTSEILILHPYQYNLHSIINLYYEKFYNHHIFYRGLY
jgi:hypothetical protein